MKPQPLLAMFLALALVVSRSGAATFSDTDFAPANWSTTVLVQTGSAQSPSSGQTLAGGNPGAFRRMIDGFSAGAGEVQVYHEYTGGSFDPATLPSGEALLLNYSEDSVQCPLAEPGCPPFVGLPIGARPAIRQDGVVYVGRDLTFTQTSWISQPLPGLSAVAFTQFAGTAHPDFGATGGVIHFGYLRSTSTNTGSFLRYHGIDNWSFSTSSIPVGTVLGQRKISDTAGAFAGTLANSDRFGECVAYLGDVDCWWRIPAESSRRPCPGGANQRRDGAWPLPPLPVAMDLDCEGRARQRWISG